MLLGPGTVSKGHCPSAAYSASEESSLRKEGGVDTRVILGSDAETQKEVTIGADARARSMYVTGITGTGKSTFLENIAHQDMQNGDGVCFLDPHGDSAKKLLASVPKHREGDVIYWDPSDLDKSFGLNPFDCPDPKEIDSRADNFIAALASLKEFKEIFDTAPLMKIVLNQLAITFLVNQGYTLAEAPEFLMHARFRNKFYPALDAEYPQVRRFWERMDDLPKSEERAQIASSLNKLQRFQNNRIMRGIFGQPKSCIDFRQAMDSGAILLVKLSVKTLGQDNSAFVGAFVVWEILQAAFSRENVLKEERRPFHLFADEFQTYMTTAFPTLQTQARKYGLDLVVAHQVRGQLEPEVAEIARAVGNLVVFRVTGSNAMSLAGEFDTTPPNPVPPPRRQARLVLARSPWKRLIEQGHPNPEVETILEKWRAIYEEPEPFSDKPNLGYRKSRFWAETSYEKMEQWILPAEWPPKRYQSQAYEKYEYTLQTLTSEDLPSQSGLAYADCRHGVALRYRLKYTRSGREWEQWAVWEQIINHYLLASERRQGEQDAFQKTVEELVQIFNLAARDLKGLSFRSRRPGEVAWNEKQRRYRGIAGQGAWQHGIPEHLGREIVFKSETEAAAAIRGWIQKQIRAAIENDVKRLGEILAGDPITVESGLYEALPEAPIRTYSDMAAEISNQLVGLANFQARCKLSQEHGRPRECLIYTQPYRGEADEERSLRLVDRSRQLYGRDRGEVERAIERRLRIQPARADNSRNESPGDVDGPVLREKAKVQAHSPRRSQ